MSLFWYILPFVLLVTLTDAIPVFQNVDVPKKTDTDKSIDYRLPENVKPTFYTIKLEPNIVPHNFIFNGESIIDITIAKPTNKIVLHAKDLTIDNINLIYENDTKVDAIIIHTIDNQTDFLTITLSKDIEPGKYALSLNFVGSLNDELNGFYRSSYINHHGQEIWLATTQFEPTWARRAFPCFDEPAFKAKFKISIKHFDNYTAVSNMPVILMERPNNDISKWWSHFDVTPIMSTYLVAFVVSDFTFLATDDGKFRVYSTDNLINTGKYAHKIGRDALKHLETYTNIPYAMPKMDNFAIPQFRAGAMENWGIVTYRESALLVDENVTTTESKQGVATVISHEFAHQWFGNLVSPSWWDYTWLNEGFATYFQYYITSQIETTWRLMDQFVIKNLQQTAFVADDNVTQHAMDAKVNSPDEISKIFDDISYRKAGCVIRMFAHALGEKVFNTGLTNYLNKYKYSAATSDQLFTELSTVADKSMKIDLTKALTSWSKQAGYPVITVIRNYKTGVAEISQKRFLTNTNETRTEIWVIPINYVIQENHEYSDTKPMEWLLTEKKNITINNLKTNNWVIFNKQQTGYYRVNYDTENWKLIIDNLKNTSKVENIHVLNRAQLLDDSFNLAQAGELPNHDIFLQISEYLRNEVDYVPWYAAYRAFTVMNKALANTGKYHLFKLYILRLTEKLEKAVGYSETVQDDHILKLNRLNAVKLACTMGSPKCLAATYKKLGEHVSGTNKISTDLQNVVFCAGIRSANAMMWERIYNHTMKLKNDSNERRIFINALGCSSDVNILAQYLQKSLPVESELNRGDVIKAVLDGNAAGINIVFDFMKANLDYMLNEVDSYKMVIDSMNELGSRLTTASQAKKLEDFINSLPAKNKELADALKAVALVRATKNVAWLKKHESQIASFLNAQKLVPEEPSKDDPGSSNTSLPSILLTSFMVIASTLITKIH